MYIGITTQDLLNHQVYELEYSLKEGTRFIGKDGVLYKEIRAGYIKVLKDISKGEFNDFEGYIEVENSENKKFIELKTTLNPEKELEEAQSRITELEAETKNKTKANDELETKANDELETKANDELETKANDELETKANDELETKANDDLETKANDELETKANDELETKANDELETKANDELEVKRKTKAKAKTN